MLPEVRADGKGDSARNGLKEAGWRTCGPTNRNRIEGSASGRVGTTQRSPWGSGGRVNAAVVHERFTFLSGEICLLCVRVDMSVIMVCPEAPFMATWRIGRQKSAEGIVGQTEGPNVEMRGGVL